jgi:hypothetical protein
MRKHASFAMAAAIMDATGQVTPAAAAMIATPVRRPSSYPYSNRDRI